MKTIFVILLLGVGATLVTIVMMRIGSLTSFWPTRTPLESMAVRGHDHHLLPKWVLSGATGLTFSGETVRQFPKDHLKFHAFNPESRRSNSQPDLTHLVKSGQ
jgi:hypothetical protein